MAKGGYTKPVEPITGADAEKGAKLTMEDISHILNGSVYPDYDTDHAADTISLDSPPSGMCRCVMKAIAIVDEIAPLGCRLQMIVTRDNVDYPIGQVTGTELQVIGVDAAAYNQTSDTEIIREKFLLMPGDVLTATEQNGNGYDIRLTIMYKDVYL